MAEEQKKACPLETLSFALLSGDTLYRKLAAMFIKAEDGLRSASNRRRWDVDERSVGDWLKGVYTTVRGEKKTTIEKIIEEVHRQKAIRRERSKNPPIPRDYHPKLTKESRRKAVAKSLYGVLYKGHYDKEHKELDSRCKVLTSYGDFLVAVDEGDYSNEHLVFIRNKVTGESKLVSLGKGEKKYGSLPGLFYTLAPKNIRSVLFEGVRIRVDLNRCAFIVEGDDPDEPEVVPWKIEDEIITGPPFTKLLYKRN